MGSIAPASASSDAHSLLLQSLEIQYITIKDRRGLGHVSTIRTKGGFFFSSELQYLSKCSSNNLLDLEPVA